jgi:GT2 family glycosyltransferase
VRATSGGPATLPSCSVIVPTHRRPDAVDRCLEALARLDYPPELLEVIVVDDGGDGTLERVVAAHADRLRVTLVGQARGGPGAARNRAAAEATGGLLVFTDDDCRPEPGWLHAMAAKAVDAPGCAVGGRTVNALPANRFSRVSQLVLDLVYAHYNVDGADPRFFTSNNVAFPAEGYRRIGGFDPELPTAEDRDLCDRWVRQGGRMTYAPDAVVLHDADLTLAEFVRKHFRYGRGACRFLTGTAGRDRRRDVARFYTDLPRARRFLRGSSATDAAVVALWQLANSAGFVWEAASRLLPSKRSGRVW